MTAAEIAETLRMPLSTVSGILTRIGMGRLGRLGLEQPVRYERSRPGELVHIDIKKLGRIQGGAGWRVRGGPQHYNRTYTDQDGLRRRSVGYEYVHICVDDYSRLAYAEVLPDEKATTAAGFLRRAVAFYRRYGITRRARAHRQRRRLHLDHPRARLPHDSASATSAPAPTAHKQTAKPNASSAPCSTAGPTAPSTAQATNAPRALDGWLWHYNHQRRHSALGHQPPITRTNLLGSCMTSSSSNQKRPTVPGPACVPTTAPSVVAISICACGRAVRDQLARAPASRSGAAAWAMPTRSDGESLDRRLEKRAELLERLLACRARA